MSEGLNRVMLLGNLTEDPTLRFTQAGQAVLNMRLATNESYLDKDKVRRERVDYHNVVCWGKRGEALAKILVKGSAVFIEGSLRTSSYDNREGVKVYKTEIVTSNVILTGGRPHPDGGGGDAGEYSESAEDGAGGEGYAPRAAAPRAAAGGGDAGEFKIDWGQNNGTPLSALSARDLAFHKDKAIKELDDPSKSKFHEKGRRLLDAIEALETRRANGSAPAAPQKSGVPGGSAPSASGGGYQRGGRQADGAPRAAAPAANGNGRGAPPSRGPSTLEHDAAPFDDGVGEGNGPDSDIPF